MLKGIINKLRSKGSKPTITKNNESNVPDLIKIHNKFVSELLYDPLPKWDHITLHFEYFKWKEDYFRVFSLKRYLDNNETKFDLSLEAEDVLIELNEAMAQNGKEPWTWLEFTLDDTGQCDFDFKYDIPPNVKTILENAEEI